MNKNLQLISNKLKSVIRINPVNELNTTDQQKANARIFIQATTEFLRIAMVKAGNCQQIRQINDDMSKALEHQQEAMDLYESDSAEKAIEYSFQARKFAIAIIDQSKNYSAEPTKYEPLI